MPRQLPAPPAHFANRARELSGLDAKARGRASNPGLVVLKGPGGVGKSALALHWLDGTRDRFPDGQLYARLAQPSGDPVAVEDVLGEFLRALGVAPDHVPAGFSERVTLFRTVTAGRSVALLLEDAVSAAQVKALLPASPAGVVLVTSTRPLPALFTDGAEVVPVEPLDDRGAVDLLTRHIGTERVAAERSAVATLVGFCAGLPIALCVAAAQLVLRPHRPVARLVADLRDEHRRLDVLSMDDDDLSVRATLDLSTRALPPDATAAYRSIGAHPGRLVCPELVAATTRFGRARARRALDALADASLLREIDDEVYQCHDLVRAHAYAATAGLDLAEREALTRTTIEWHLHVARETGAAVLPSRRRVPFQQSGRFEIPAAAAGRDGSLRWLARHRPDLSALVRLAAEHGLHDLAYALGDALQPLFIVHGHRREAVAVDEHALRAATAMGDDHAQASMRKRLARVLADLGETASARAHVDELITSGDRRTRASGLKVRAKLHTSAGRYAEAVADCREAVAILREIDQGRPEALALAQLGTALLDAGQPRDAVSPLDEARAILQAVGDPFNVARAAIPLARAHLRLGEHDAARVLLDEADRVLAEHGADRQLGRTHETFAELYEQTGDPDRAAAHRDRAAELFARDPAPCSQVD